MLSLWIFTIVSSFYFTPSISPQDSLISFVYMGDVWILDLNSKFARRLTDSKGYESGPVFWSDDGKYVFFVSDRYGSPDIFRMSVDGIGDPIRLTFHPASEKILGVKGDNVYFLSSRTEYRGAVYRVSVNGGFPERVWNFVMNNISFGPDKTVFFERGYTRLWRRKYRGPANRDIWVMKESIDDLHKITDFDGRDAFPMFSNYDGKVYFLSNDNEQNVSNLFRMDVNGTNKKQITFFEEEVRSPFISKSGKNIVFTVMGKIYLYNVVKNRIDTLSFYTNSDKKNANPYYKTLTKDATEFSISPRGNEIAFVLYGDIFVMKLDKDGMPSVTRRLTFTPEPEKDLTWNPKKEEIVFSSLRDGNWELYSIKPIDDSLLCDATEFSIKRLTHTPVTEKSPLFSPNGKFISFKREQGKLYVMSADGTQVKKLSDFNDILWVSWSWDSKWIGFSRTDLGWREDIYVVPVNGETKPVNITNHPNDDYKPMWSYDGRRISFASRDEDGNLFIKYVVLRKEDVDKDAEYFKSLKDTLSSPPPVKIDFDGISVRIRTIYRFQGGYNYVAQDKWGLLFAVEAEDLGGDDIWKIDINGRNLKRLTRNAKPVMFSFFRDGKKICYLAYDGRIHTVSLTGEDKTLAFKQTILVRSEDFRRAQMLQLWWLLNDGFYDPGFHGVNWKKMLEKYLPYGINIYEDEEFYTLVSYMLGELNASHLGIWGRRLNFTEKTGLLGGEYSKVSDGFLVNRVIYDSPLFIKGIKKGDVLLKIDRVQLDTVRNIYSAFRFLRGESVKLRYRSGKNEKEIKIEPTSYWKIRNIVYREWVRNNRRFVDSVSGGRLAYIHVRSMDLKSVNEFKKSLYSQRDKQGLVLDIRYNGGGFTHDIILNILRRSRYLYSIERGEKEREYSSNFSWDKPIVLLINSMCYSDAEIFPAGFRALGLGKIVGTPTFGGVIGTQNVNLFDGRTIFRIPKEGWYRLNNKSLELGPVEPDIYVENSPIYDNSSPDPQLKKSIEILLESIK